MKNLQIVLSHHGLEIGKSDYILLKRKNKKYLVNFENFVVSVQSDVRSYDELDVTILYNQVLYREINLCSIDNVLVPENNVIKLIVDDISYDFGYSQDVIDIFKDWDEGVKLDWRDFQDKKKRAWLVACLYSTGLPVSRPKEKNLIVDCSLVFSEVDLYCLLGQTFFGEKGYLGQDLSGLKDCMIEMKHDKSSFTSIVFFNFNLLEKRLAKGYANKVVKIFQEHDFDVKIE